jgi:hypothetical protein
MSCTLKRVLEENPFSNDIELGYEVIFSDGSTVTHFDSSTANSVPLNHECYNLEVTPVVAHLATEVSRVIGTMGSSDEKDDHLLSLISNKFCIEVIQPALTERSITSFIFILCF